MWLEDPTTQLEKAAHAAWPGVLEEAQLPIVALLLCVAVETHEEKDRARISYLVEHPNHGLFKYRLQLRPPRTGRLCRALSAVGKSVSRLSTDQRLSCRAHAWILPIKSPNDLCGLPFRSSCAMPRRSHQQLELLQTAGEWLDAYHRTKVSEIRIFQPKHAVNYYHDLSEKIQVWRSESCRQAPYFARG